MKTPVRLTTRIEESALKDGTRVWVGSIDEVPGVYTQASSEERALTELVGLLGNLHDRIPVIGLVTPGVQGWAWTIGVGMDNPVASYGSDLSGPGNFGADIHQDHPIRAVAS